MLLLALLLCAPQQVEGLHADEEWTVAAPGFDPFATQSDDSPCHYRGGRVIDALSNRPIAGATVELWTEEIDPYFTGFERVGVATSGIDGGFLVPTRLGGRSAKKARVSAPGYSTWSGVAGEIGKEIALFPAEQAATLRFVDPEGQPIAGVRVTSTYSCSHDLPALHLVSDAFGEVHLEAFGIQERSPELRVLPPGRGAIEYLDCEWIHERRPDEGVAEVVLPQRPGASMRFLDAEGEPLSYQSFYVVDGECYHVVTTDAEGILNLDCRFGAQDVSVHRRDPRQGYGARFEAELAARFDLLPTARRDARQWPSGTALGRIRLKVPSNEESLRRLRYHLVHAEGWQARSVEDEDLAEDEALFELPAGHGHFLLGGTFASYAPQHVPFDLAPGEELLLQPNWTPQPVLSFDWPEGSWNGWIEADGFSISQEDMRRNGQPVPRDTALTIHYRMHDQSVVLRHEGIAHDTELTLQAPPEPTPLPTTTRVARVRLADGRSPQDLRVSAMGWRYEIACEVDEISGLASLSGPAGAEFILRASCEGHPMATLRGRLPKADEQLDALELALEAESTLRIEGPPGWRFLNWAAELADDADDSPHAKLLTVRPGPVQLLIGLEDGRPLAIRLEVEAGEKRTIQIGAAPGTRSE